MTKRVAWFTGEPSVKDCFTPHKVYEVVREEDTNFSVINDKGVKNYCLKKGCAHICHKDWVFADVVEQTVKQETVEEDVFTTKQPKWGEWIENTTGKCPEGLKRKQKIKLKWTDGDEFNISKPHDAAWDIDKCGVNITHYKVKLKDISKDAPAKDSKDISKGQEKSKKWSDWLPNLTGNKPAELGEWQTVKVKWSDGEVCNDYASMAAWYISEDAPNITHYKVKL